MQQTIHFQLQQTLIHLQAQPVVLNKSEDQFGLRIRLATTIRNLRDLYAQELPSRQRYSLLQNLNLLEQQALVLAPPGKVALSTWQFLHTSLQRTIKDTLVDMALTHRKPLPIARAVAAVTKAGTIGG